MMSNYTVVMLSFWAGFRDDKTAIGKIKFCCPYVAVSAKSNLFSAFSAPFGRNLKKLSQLAFSYTFRSVEMPIARRGVDCGLPLRRDVSVDCRREFPGAVCVA